MTIKDKTALIVEGLTRICADVAALAAVLEDDVPQDAPVAEPAPDPEKVYTYGAFRTSLSRAFTPREMTAVSALTRTSPVPLTVIFVSASAVAANNASTRAAIIAISFFILVPSFLIYQSSSGPDG